MLKAKTNTSILSGLSKSKAWKSPGRLAPVFSSLCPSHCSFNPALQICPGLCNEEEEGMKNYTGIGQGRCGPLTAPVGWICDALNTWMWCRTACAWSGTCSLFTQSHSEGRQRAGLGIFVCGCPQGDKAGWKN